MCSTDPAHAQKRVVFSPHWQHCQRLPGLPLRPPAETGCVPSWPPRQTALCLEASPGNHWLFPSPTSIRNHICLFYIPLLNVSGYFVFILVNKCFYLVALLSLFFTWMDLSLTSLNKKSCLSWIWPHKFLQEKKSFIPVFCFTYDLSSRDPLLLYRLFPGSCPRLPTPSWLHRDWSSF